MKEIRRNCELRKELKKVKKEHELLQKSRCYEKNRLYKHQLGEMKKRLAALECKFQKAQKLLVTREEKVVQLEKEKKNLQKLISKYKAVKEKMKLKVMEREEQKDFLKDVNTDNIVITRGERNTFSDDVRTTVMSLEASGVAASKCSEVIQIVSKNLFGQVLDLPHRSTATMMVEEAHALAKLQVAECLQENTNITLHTDRTSRQKKKFIGQQLTWDDGRLISAGFREVATEDAQTLLEIMTDILEELSELYGAEEHGDLFLQFLSNIASTMSDRASVMKSFGQKFGEMRSLMLGENVRTNVLYCNAHFLLGLSSSCEQAFIEVEAELVRDTGNCTCILVNLTKIALHQVQQKYYTDD